MIRGGGVDNVQENENSLGHVNSGGDGCVLAMIMVVMNNDDDDNSGDDDNDDGQLSDGGDRVMV